MLEGPVGSQGVLGRHGGEGEGKGLFGKDVEGSCGVLYERVESHGMFMHHDYI